MEKCYICEKQYESKVYIKENEKPCCPACKKKMDEVWNNTKVMEPSRQFCFNCHKTFNHDLYVQCRKMCCMNWICDGCVKANKEKIRCKNRFCPAYEMCSECIKSVKIEAATGCCSTECFGHSVRHEIFMKHFLDIIIYLICILAALVIVFSLTVCIISPYTWRTFEYIMYAMVIANALKYIIKHFVGVILEVTDINNSSTKTKRE